MDTTTASERDAVRRISEQVLFDLELEPVEAELSLGLIDPLVELAEGGEVMPVDGSDPAGGFGGADLLVVSVVPAVFAVLKALRGTPNPERMLRQVLPRIEEVVRRTGSPRAGDRLPELMRSIRRAVQEHLTAASAL